ncbi:glycosyltransferase family 2 protein [Campylobacter sp. FMV-PI01]|uniref:Glycosyltransferase family 2 protein n=1 Tax=Campylobacter portucalensis TaxID=2608384 RepID=A0A6L5WKQ3_9BACT|nr:glycosyltransferase family 2 protein [Campylobacter portucalensis]MSN96321.1 glycosyltransferase family 2 protein [Campylobacter portucalensis]
MQNSELISIIIPVYNVEKYLKKCLDSVINQTYENLEIILVDDGSSDQSPKICDEYAQKDSRIKVIHQKNYGQAHARNRALDIMQGDWVVFIDSDDFVSIYYVENLYNLAKKYGVDIAITSLLKVRFENLKLPSFKKIDTEEVFIHTRVEAIENMFYSYKYAHFSVAKIFNSKLFLNIKFPTGLIYEDTYLMSIIFNQVDNVAFCDKEDYFYLIRKDSTSNSINQNRLDVFEICNILEGGGYFNEQKILQSIYYFRLMMCCCAVTLLNDSNNKKLASFIQKEFNNYINKINNKNDKINKINKIRLLIFKYFGVKIYFYADKIARKIVYSGYN